MSPEPISHDPPMTSAQTGWTIQWQAGQEPVVVESEEQLLQLLADAEEDAAEQPLVVEIRSPDKAALTIGLGQEASIATFASSVAPPYYVSSGGPGHDEPLVFYRYGHWTEFGSDAAISPDAAREAARRFVATGDRPSNIEWSEV